MNEGEQLLDAVKNGDFAMPEGNQEAVEVLPNAEKNETNQLCTEPESATPRQMKRKKKRKSLSKSEGAETNHMDSGHLESCPNLDTLLLKDSNPVLLPEPEPVSERNETNQLRTEPESTNPRKTKRNRKRKSLPKSEGAETNHVDSGHLASCPNLDPLPPKDSSPVLLLPVSEPVSERNKTNQVSEPVSERNKTNQVSEPVSERNETNQVCTEPESTTPRKRKRKSLSKSEGTETNHVDSGHLESCPNLDPLPQKDSNPVLLTEPEPVSKRNETSQLCTEPESLTPSKTKRKKKRKSLSKSEGAETNHVNSWHLESCPNLDPLPPKDSNPVVLPEPKPVSERNVTNQVCTELESTTPRKRKKESLSKSEGDEMNHVDEPCPNLDPLSSKDSDPVLPEPESVAKKNETDQLCIEPGLATPRKMKRKKKRKSLSKSEGAETNHIDSCHLGSCSNLDPLSPKDSNNVLLPEPEPFAEKNETNQLCIELDSTPSRKTKRKRKRKSLSKIEGVETNHVDSEHHELCANLAALPPKDPEPLLLPEPAPVGEKNKANQLCTKPDSTPPKFEGAEMTDMNFENLELCPKSDSLPPKDSNPLMLPQSETALLKEVEQKKKRKKKKKKKNKSELIGEGVESNRPNDEHFQHCHKAKSTTPEEWNQRKRKRHVMNETHERLVMNEIHNSSIWSMLNPDYNLRPIIGASILNSEVVDRGPWVPKRPLKSYEQYERCLECRQICQGDQKCRGLIHLERGQKFCFFCSTVGHSLGECPVSPGAKCARGIIMLDDYVRKNCGEKSQTPHREVAPANVPTFYAHFQPSNIQPYPAPMVRPMNAHFILSRN